MSSVQQEKSHPVPVQAEGSVPPSVASPSPVGLQSEVYDASRVLPSLSSLCSSSSSSQP